MGVEQKRFMGLPQVEQLLHDPALTPFIQTLSRPLVTDIIRDVLVEARSHLRQQPVSLPNTNNDNSSHADPHPENSPLLNAIRASIGQRCQQLQRRRHHKVINGTGTVIHTNLGRSPIHSAVWDAVGAVNTSQCNLEIKLSDGKRGQRKGLVDCLLAKLTGADDAVVVNNNASSIYLLLNELAAGKEVIVSRGEQIQIGGGFRIPDILALSGATLVEVGTTNITTADDYLQAITDNTALVLMVHTSNFAIRGFTQSPAPAELARKLPEHVMLVVDQGSGLTTERFAAEETPVSSYVRAGADLVCFSGDKILGGPQAGIICGNKALIHRLEKNPLMRVLRPGRVIYSLLEELLVQKLNKTEAGQGFAEQVTCDPKSIKRKATELLEGLESHMTITESEMIVGGGTLPDESFPSWAVELQSQRSAKQVLKDLRTMSVPVVGVIRNDRVQLNLASVLPHDLTVLRQQLCDYFAVEGN